MSDTKKEAIAGEEFFSLSIQEITYSLGIDTAVVMNIVDEGIISVKKDENNEWKFDNEAFRRIRMVVQLEKDLGINMAGACLAIELLNEIERLKAMLK